MNMQRTTSDSKSVMIVQAHQTFERAETEQELLFAAMKAKIAGDESLLERFDEIMAAGGPNKINRKDSFDQLSDEELNDVLRIFDTKCQ